jgi:23S rRNA (guanosine2251-2'-O)-methyltransferase
MGSAAAGKTSARCGCMTDKAETVLCSCLECHHAFPVASALSGHFGDCPGCGDLIVYRPQRAQQMILQRAGRQPSGAGFPDRPKIWPIAAILDDIRSRWNVGSMFRTADGAGLQDMVLCGISPVPGEQDLSRSALGAEHTVPWRYRPDVLSACREAAAQGFHILVLERTPRALPLFEYTPPGPVALVIGNEVHGVHPRLLEISNTTLSIPMYGLKESLNAAVAFGIAVYHLVHAFSADRS